MREKTAIQAVLDMKKSQFGLTGIKVELEAQLDRSSHGGGDCDYCEGTQEQCCGDCDGDGDWSCDDCYAGDVDCGECSGTGLVDSENDAGDTVEIDCEDCDGTGALSCDSCDGDGRIDCERCDGTGRTECPDCYDTDTERPAWGNVSYCQNWILEKLETHGLSEQINGEWQPKLPLVFARFYNDGSVDSELTFTISMDDPKNVLLIPKVVQAFKDMATEMGADINTNGAGMHTALLNTENCFYSSHNGQWVEREGDRERYFNYKKSMNLLMPALYFLGSTSEFSRAMEYRRPGVGSAMFSDGNGKRSAINWNFGALEFRVFETCYDNPEQTLDNIVVMRNTIKYWDTTYQRNYLSNVTKKIKFGVEGNRRLDRFYILNEHVDLLNKGLKMLKPSYLTVRELKQQRNFKVDKRYIKNRDKRLREEATISYKEYEERYTWRVEIDAMGIESRNMAITLYREEDVTRLNRAEVEQKARAEAEAWAKQELARKQSLEEFVKQKLKAVSDRGCGQYWLEAQEV